MRNIMWVTVFVGLVAMAGCSDFSGLADNARPSLTLPGQFKSDAPAASPSAINTPVIIKAKGVIKKGDTSGTYNDTVYSCGNADCSLAVRGSLPTPQAQSSGAKKK